jgi:hypothetical protein
MYHHDYWNCMCIHWACVHNYASHYTFLPTAVSSETPDPSVRPCIRRWLQAAPHWLTLSFVLLLSHWDVQLMTWNCTIYINQQQINKKWRNKRRNHWWTSKQWAYTGSIVTCNLHSQNSTHSQTCITLPLKQILFKLQRNNFWFWTNKGTIFGSKEAGDQQTLHVLLLSASWGHQYYKTPGDQLWNNQIQISYQ